jgi:hypothetical protein
MISSWLINDDNLTYEIELFACEYCAKMASKSVTCIAGLLQVAKILILIFHLMIINRCLVWYHVHGPPVTVTILYIGPVQGHLGQQF